MGFYHLAEILRRKSTARMVAAGSLTPDGRAGLAGTAAAGLPVTAGPPDYQPSLAGPGPPAAAACPQDYQAVPAAGRPPAASAGQTALSADAAASPSCRQEPDDWLVQPCSHCSPAVESASTVHDDAFHE